MDAFSELSGGISANLEGVSGGFITSASLSPAGIFGAIVVVALVVLVLVAFCFIFRKAGFKWYEALVSGHNTYTAIVATGKPGWYIFLLAIPYVVMLTTTNYFPGAVKVIGILVMLAYLYFYVDLTRSMARRFKKGNRFALGMLLLPFVFYPILGFGKSVYHKK